jgi:hypothetical protein
MSACRNIFSDKFDQLKHEMGVQRRLREECFAKLDEFVAAGILDLNFADCYKDTVHKAIALFLRVMIHHKIKVLNRGISKSTSVKRNRKAMKVLHK